MEEIRMFRNEPSILFGNPTPGGPPSIGQAIAFGGAIPQVISGYVEETVTKNVVDGTHHYQKKIVEEGPGFIHI
jgi:hypothetical protein